MSNAVTPSGSSVQAVLPVRILDLVAIPFSRDLPYPGIELVSPALHAGSSPSEPQGKPKERDNKG